MKNLPVSSPFHPPRKHRRVLEGIALSALLGGVFLATAVAVAPFASGGSRVPAGASSPDAGLSGVRRNDGGLIRGAAARVRVHGAGVRLCGGDAEAHSAGVSVVRSHPLAISF